MINNHEMDELRDKGLLIARAVEHNGVACPTGYKLVQCNLDHVLFLEWDPIGIWESTPNQVLRLAKAPCFLAIHKLDGTKMHFSFKENDFRYIVDKWLMIYSQDKVELSR
jgi:hypothetical protein